ncbi:MAG: hypothetical protein Q7J27_11680 [Syntrophales bacterium]|nr:hypothetical protein [Syntrophales bacterium]
MENIIERREQIYDHFHHSDACGKFFFSDEQEERYAAYYTSMYLLQDTTESLIAHRKKGFSNDPYIAYIEFWGIMQAIIIQQDALCELYEAVTGSKLDTRNKQHWQSLRNLRNICAGHPAKKDRTKASPLIRSFMGRGFGDYSSVMYEKWESGSETSHPEVYLGGLIDKYAHETKMVISNILSSLKKQWP